MQVVIGQYKNVEEIVFSSGERSVVKMNIKIVVLTTVLKQGVK
jgi:hypothetical protein